MDWTKYNVNHVCGVLGCMCGGVLTGWVETGQAPVVVGQGGPRVMLLCKCPAGGMVGWQHGGWWHGGKRGYAGPGGVDCPQHCLLACTEFKQT